MTAFLDAAVEPALAFLAAWALRWAVPLGLLAAWFAVRPPRRAATRHLFCWAVLLAGLLLPVVPRWGPTARLPSEEATGGSPVATTDNTSGPADDSPPPPSDRADLPAAERPPEAAAAPWDWRRGLVLTLALAWAAGVGVMLARGAAGRLLLARLRRTAVPLTGEPLHLFAACRAELGLRRPARLAAHPAVRSPLTLGLLRPMVLVPPDWPRLAPAVQRGAVLHELAHLVRRDDWSALVLELVRTVFFFHPLVRWLLARLEHERELLCDEAVLARGIAPHDYARVLLEFARHPGRLAPAAPLALGGRTVKARITHLLEETMGPAKSPLRLSHAVALGAVVLGLALALGSFFRPGAAEAPAAAAEPKPAAAPEAPAEKPPGPKEALRYGGKSFEQWREELKTELKPDLRSEGIRALREFGVNGYGKEAVAAILELVRGYDVASADSDDEHVMGAARHALKKIGAASVGPLAEELKTGQTGRRFALTALQELGAKARPALPQVLAAFKDGDARVRFEALRAARAIDPQAAELVPALAGMLKDEDVSNRGEAAAALGRLGANARAAVPALLDALKDEAAVVRSNAMASLIELRPEPKTAVPALSEAAVKDTDERVWRAALSLLGGMGAEAKGAVPVLVEALKDSIKDVNLRQNKDVLLRQPIILHTLGEIGPAAKEAVPALTDLLKDPYLGPQAAEVLRKITR